MKYVKVLGLKEHLGRYDREKNLILVDYSHGFLAAFLVSFHEAIHKIIDFLSILDTLDFFDCLFNLAKKGKLPSLQVFRLTEVIYFDKSGSPYRMVKANGEWIRVDYDAWELEAMKKEKKE